MMAEDTIELEVEVLAKDTTEEDLDKMARNLLNELNQITDVTSAHLLTIGTVPDGSKAGEVVTIGTLAVTALPIVLPGIIDMIKDWATRGRGRTVKFKGKGIDFEGSAEDLHRLLKTLDKGKKKK